MVKAAEPAKTSVSFLLVWGHLPSPSPAQWCRLPSPSGLCSRGLRPTWAPWALSGPRHHWLASHLPSWEAALWDWSTFCRTGIKTKAPWKNDSETCSCFVFQEPQRTLPCFPLAFVTCSDVAQRLPSTSSCSYKQRKWVPRATGNSPVFSCWPGLWEGGSVHPRPWAETEEVSEVGCAHLSYLLEAFNLFSSVGTSVLFLSLSSCRLSKGILMESVAFLLDPDSPLVSWPLSPFPSASQGNVHRVAGADSHAALTHTSGCAHWSHLTWKFAMIEEKGRRVY